MDKGSVFDYDMKSWVVLQVCEYQWQNGSTSVEYLVDSGADQWYMSVELDDDIEIVLCQRVKVRVIDPNLPDLIIRSEQPPHTLNYKGTQYLLDSEAVGMFREEGAKDWSDLISWDYFDSDDKKTLSIEQWGERDFEAAAGLVVKDYEITNILPSPSR